MPRPADMAPAEPAPLDWRDESTVACVRAALEARSHYRDDVSGPIELVQTHISSVFLTPGHVFKFKRPVDLGFADFSTRALRERYCHAEVTLNRRLAEGVYLDVLPLCEAGEGYALEGDGPVVDYCVVMRHLPPEDMMDARLREREVGEAELDALARLLVDFHGRPESGGPDVAPFGAMATLQENWDENFAQTEAYVGEALGADVFGAIRAAVADWMARHRDLLEARVAGGCIRDGHGDLRCEHVYLDGGPEDIKIIDCVEFNDRFRYGDVANDLAFLLMDLTAQGHPGLARTLMDRYVAHSGDAELPRLVAFYACYRAYVRGKVGAFKLADRNLPEAERERVRERAGMFFRLAQDFTRQMAPPVLVLVSGLMGTGKTALAETIAARAGIATYNSDAVRKALATEAGETTAAGSGADYGEGIYTPEWNARTYAALAERADMELAAGSSVVLDASFAQRSERERARALAARQGARTVIVECRLDEARTRERLQARERAGTSVSDGREALYERQRAAFEPIAADEADAHLVVTTDAPPEALVDGILPRLALPPPLFGMTR